MFDLSTNSARCSITGGVGNNPSHVAVIADSSLLFVENDGDATISVISLVDGSTQATIDLTLSGVTKGASGITGNLAISPDLTFAYVAAFPAPLPSPPPAPVLVRIGIVPGFNTSNPGPLPSNGNQAAGDIGIVFLPDASGAYVAFDAGNTYEITVSPFSVSPIIAAVGPPPVTVTGGGVTVSASAGGSSSGDFAYVVQTPNQTGANPIQIPVATNIPAPTGTPPPPAPTQTICSQGNTITTSPDGSFAYYTCPANNSVQIVNISQNQVTNTVNIPPPPPPGTSPTPLGVIATSDNSELLVANQNGSISVITSLTAATPTVSTSSGLGGALNGAVQRPIHPAISPSAAQNVATNKTIQFTASTSYAVSPQTTLTNTVWKVNGTVGGDSTHGTISTTGLYKAPATPPNPPTVTVTATVTSTEFPIKSLFYPGQSGSASVAVTVLLPIAVAVSANPTNLDLSTSTTAQITATVNNDPAAKGVTWDVNGVTPGTTTTGTVSPTTTASGAATTYTAPKMISPPSFVKITATSVSDPAATGSVTLPLTSSITFSPIAFNPSAPLLIENTDTFSTTLTGDPYNQNVTWSIVGCSAAPAPNPTSACGTINSSTGLFTPPLIVPYASQSAPVAPATITFLATSVTDTAKTSQTNPIQITSNVAITGFQVNGAAPPAQLFIETTSYALTATLTGDTGPGGQGVKWSIASCSADPAGGPLCGTVNVGGTYAPPAIVPYTLPVTSSSIATVTFKATSIADVLVSKLFPINIGSNVSITGYNINGAAPAPPLLIETASYKLTPVISGDTGQGVIWSILGCSAINPVPPAVTTCGRVNKFDINTGAYAPPSIVPYALPVTSSSTATITFQVTSIADPKVIFQPTAIAISSNIAITGYQVNGAAPPAKLLIETSTYALSPGPFITGDTGQGVIWSILGCSAINPVPPGDTTCGRVNKFDINTGAYAPPSIVPYALPVTSSSTATIAFQVTSVADPKVVFQPPAIGIGSSIALSVVLPAQVLIGSSMDLTAGAGIVTLTNDTGQGVSVSQPGGSCFYPPNFTSPTNPCGTTAGNTYIAPLVVPLAAATPAASLGQAQKAQITLTVSSVADPVVTGQITFPISSNISFAIALATDAQTVKNVCNPFFYSPTDSNILTELATDPCGFGVTSANTGWPVNGTLSPPSPSLAVSLPATLMVSPTAQGFGNVTGLTWVASSGSVTCGGSPAQPTCGTPNGTSTTFAATALPGTPCATSAVTLCSTITAYVIADFTQKAAFSMQIVASKLTPHSFLATTPFTPAPFTLTVASGQSSGNIQLDFLGPTTGQIAFTCPTIAISNAICAASPNSTNASTTGTTTVTYTVSVTRGGNIIRLRPPVAPLSPRSSPLVMVLLTILLTLSVLVISIRKCVPLTWVAAPRRVGGMALLALCAMVVTWAVACGQFSQPPTTPAPPISGTPPSGSVAATGTPTTDASSSTDSLTVPVAVQP